MCPRAVTPRFALHSSAKLHLLREFAVINDTKYAFLKRRLEGKESHNSIRRRRCAEDVANSKVMSTYFA